MDWAEVKEKYIVNEVFRDLGFKVFDVYNLSEMFIFLLEYF